MENKISLIITVKNEEQAIEKLLESVAAQTVMPDEVVISDAGSTDNTRKRIKHFKNKIKKLKLLDVSDSNRSQGRNIAIKHCDFRIIAVTDAGCTLKSDWLEKITKKIIQRKAESVAGFYLADAQTLMQRSITPFVAVMPDQLDTSKYLPSSRSVAFRKSAWEKAGKYPEDVEYCEDLLFARMLKAKTKMLVEPEAIVYWQQAKSLAKFYRQIQHYAQGDLEARYHPHLIKISTIFIRYIIFWVFPPLFFAYLFWPIYKHIKHVHHPLAVIYLPIIQITSDLAIITGILKKVL